MPLITPQYRDLNASLHATRADYGKRSIHHLPQLLKRFQPGDSVLDYGAGKNTLVPVLREQGYHATAYDPCVPDLADTLHDHGAFSWIVCTDVLEHIEPDCLDEVLMDLWRRTFISAYIQIALRHDRTKNLPDGTNPHRIVETWDWWQQRLDPYFEVEQLIHHKPGAQVTFWAKPKLDLTD